MKGGITIICSPMGESLVRCFEASDLTVFVANVPTLCDVRGKRLLNLRPRSGRGSAQRGGPRWGGTEVVKGGGPLASARGLFKMAAREKKGKEKEEGGARERKFSFFSKTIRTNGRGR